MESQAKYAALRVVIEKRLRLNLTSGRLILVTVLLLILNLAAGLNAYHRQEERQELYQIAQFSHLDALGQAQIYDEVRVGLERPPEHLSFLSEGLGERFGTSVAVGGESVDFQILARELPEASGTVYGELDFARIAALLMTLLAFLTSYDAFSGERAEGTLQLCLSNALSRHRLLLGEYLGGLASLAVPLLLALLTTFLALFLLPGFEVGLEEGVRIALISLSCLLLLSACLLLGLACSALSRDAASSFVFAFSLWILIALTYPNLTLWAAQRWYPVTIEEHTLSASGVFDLALTQLGHLPAATRQRLRESTQAIAANERFAQAEVNDSLKLLTPVSNFLALAQILSRTDLESQREFHGQARRLAQMFADWKAEKLRRYPERADFYDAEWGPIDLDGLPSPTYRPIPLQASLGRSVPYWAALMIFNLLFYLLASRLVDRYDVRF